MQDTQQTKMEKMSSRSAQSEAAEVKQLSCVVASSCHSGCLNGDTAVHLSQAVGGQLGGPSEGD